MKKIGIFRLSVQILALILVNLGFVSFLETGIICPAFYCYGCPSASTACPIGTLQTYTSLNMIPYYTIGSLGLFGLFLGRFWCGWFCPFGTLQDLIMRIRHRNDIIKLPPFPWTKYLALIGILVAVGISFEYFFCKVCPAGSLFAAIPHRFINPEFNFGTFFYVHLITLAVSLILFVLVGRFWCRYLCPLGAIFGLFNRVSLVKVKLDEDKCTECQQCLQKCPVNFKKLTDVGNSSDCVQCAKCIDACPMEAIHICASFRS